MVSVASPDPQERLVLHAADGRAHEAPTQRQSGAQTYAALLGSLPVAASTPAWQAVCDPAASTAVVATLVEAAAQLDDEDRPASHRRASS